MQKKLGMEFWLYDENGWPSGNGDGRVMRRFPDSVCAWLEMRDGRVQRMERPGFNTFRRDEMRYFISEIYDGYRLGLAPEAFDWVTGFFSDEVGFLDGHGASIDRGGIPWCEEVAEAVRAALGQEAFRPELLFLPGEGAARIRYLYWQAITDVLAQAFYGAVNDWCKKWRKRYTAHLKGEENIFFQIPCSGSCFQQLKQVNLPAVDALERYPGNGYYPRIASSVSRQFSAGVPDTPAGSVSRNFSGLAERLHESGLPFDVTDERTLEAYGRTENGRLVLGRASYGRVIFGAGCLWEKDGAENAFRAHVPCLEGGETAWRFDGVNGMNQYPLFTRGERRARVPYEGPLHGLRLRMMDGVGKVLAGGVSLRRASDGDSCVFLLPDMPGSGVLEVEIEPAAGGEQKPLGFLEGHFLVRNRAGYESRDGGRQWRAEDGFFLTPLPEETDRIDCADLTASGFPFCGKGVYVTALRYAGPEGMLRLGRVNADAAFVSVKDGDAWREIGWAWGGAWTVKTDLPEGFCPVRLRLIPSTYNTYGPTMPAEETGPLSAPPSMRGRKISPMRPTRRNTPWRTHGMACASASVDMPHGARVRNDPGGK